MSYTIEQQHQILKLKKNKLSSRLIAKELGISKSGVNYFIAREGTVLDDDTPVREPRILVFDLETAAALALTFGRFKVNLSQDHIVKEGGFILCASYRWLGDDNIYSIALTQEEVLSCDDSRLVGELWDLYEQADAVVAHNAQQFDHKMLQTRCSFNGFNPLPSVKILDTLVLAKKHLRLPSNKLDSIADYYNLGRKVSHSGIDLWKRVQSGDKKAMQEMVTYCIQDTALLTDVYYQLRAIGHAGSDFNAALYYEDDKTRCRRCGSHEVEATGRQITTSLSVFNEYRCSGCGAIQRDRVASTTKAKRSSLLT